MGVANTSLSRILYAVLFVCTFRAVGSVRYPAPRDFDLAAPGRTLEKRTGTRPMTRTTTATTRTQGTVPVPRTPSHPRKAQPCCEPPFVDAHCLSTCLASLLGGADASAECCHTPITSPAAAGMRGVAGAAGAPPRAEGHEAEEAAAGGRGRGPPQSGQGRPSRPKTPAAAAAAAGRICRPPHEAKGRTEQRAAPPRAAGGGAGGAARRGAARKLGRRRRRRKEAGRGMRRARALRPAGGDEVRLAASSRPCVRILGSVCARGARADGLPAAVAIRSAGVLMRVP